MRGPLLGLGPGPGRAAPAARAAYSVVTVKRPSAREGLAVGIILACRACACLSVVYVVLLVLSLASHPYGACNAVGDLLGQQLCDCSCYVADATQPSLAFYHPGAPLAAVAGRTVRPQAASAFQTSVCGACPADFEACVALAARSRGCEVALRCNASSLACYTPVCAAQTAAFYAASGAGAAAPADDLCRLGGAAPACRVGQAAPERCGTAAHQAAAAGCAPTSVCALDE
jgi:hypothetical protein